MTVEEMNEAMVVIRGVMDDVRPMDMSTAQKANVSAEMIFDTGHHSAILQVLASGMNREWSREHSHIRRASREASSRIITDLSKLTDFPRRVITQLSFPIVSPGLPPTPLSGAKHDLIGGAYFNEVRQLRGRTRNIALLAHYMTLTAPWPDDPVGVLIDRGDLTIKDLVLPEGQSADTQTA